MKDGMNRIVKKYAHLPSATPRLRVKQQRRQSWKTTTPPAKENPSLISSLAQDAIAVQVFKTKGVTSFKTV
jgi:hypothetical protein